MNASTLDASTLTPPVPPCTDGQHCGKSSAGVSSHLAPELLIAFLTDPASYPHRPERVTLVQTHISYVALAPPLVYKVKKPASFGFLDFSTLDARRHYCEEEVRLNRRLCARIYRRVVPITREGDGLTWDGEGEPVEVAVEMDQLGAEGFLDERVERGHVTTADIDRVAEKLAAFYRRQPASPEAAAWGRPERLRISTDENVAQTERFAGELLSRPAFEALRFATDLFLSSRTRLLHRRRAEGRLVDGHGDLRAEHVHLSDAPDVATSEAVCIFDCIEFNERFRYVDVAADVAFLAMDLDRLGRPDLGRHFAAQLAARLSDPDLLAVLDFYKGYRAYVRGKVEAMRSTETEVPPAERAALYAPERTEATYAALRDAALQHMRQGHGLVLDATFGSRRQREALREVLQAAGGRCRFVELVAPDDLVRRRLAARDRAGGVVSDARLEDLAALTARYDAPDALEDPEHVVVRTDESPEAATREILLHLVCLNLP